jgi:hypothetical protein
VVLFFAAAKTTIGSGPFQYPTQGPLPAYLSRAAQVPHPDPLLKVLNHLLVQFFLGRHRQFRVAIPQSFH